MLAFETPTHLQHLRLNHASSGMLMMLAGDRGDNDDEDEPPNWGWLDGEVGEQVPNAMYAMGGERRQVRVNGRMVYEDSIPLGISIMANMAFFNVNRYSFDEMRARVRNAQNANSDASSSNAMASASPMSIEANSASSMSEDWRARSALRHANAQLQIVSPQQMQQLPHDVVEQIRTGEQAQIDAIVAEQVKQNQRAQRNVRYTVTQPYITQTTPEFWAAIEGGENPDPHTYATEWRQSVQPAATHACDESDAEKRRRGKRPVSPDTSELQFEDKRGHP